MHAGSNATYILYIFNDYLMYVMRCKLFNCLPVISRWWVLKYNVPSVVVAVAARYPSFNANIGCHTTEYLK